ncbi:hypothetical protein ACJX0J_030832, partial [Zea mays]
EVDILAYYTLSGELKYQFGSGRLWRFLPTRLIHGGSSGIGTFAIQIAKYLGIKVFVTAGVDVIRDNIGGSYLQRNLNNLGVDGRLFIIGFQGGIAAEVNLQAVLARRLTIQ